MSNQSSQPWTWHDLEALDTLFFRDGRSFEAGVQGVASHFPPYPRTTAGALRAALARSNGWDGQSNWVRSAPQLTAPLGDGPQDTGALRVVGPLLAYEGQTLYPAPLSMLLKTQVGAPYTLDAVRVMQPGPEIACDLGDAVRLPTGGAWSKRHDDTPTEGMKSATGWWVDADQMTRALAGKPLNHNGFFRHKDQLWRQELRIGLQRHRDSRTAVEGMLYSSLHTRPMRGVSLRVGHRFTEATPSDWSDALGAFLPLGGEGRQVRVQPSDAHAWPEMPELVEKDERLYFTLVALTPLMLGAEAGQILDPRAPKKTIPGLEWAELISVCTDKGLRIGGWDSKGGRAVTMQPCLPAGTVLYYTALSSKRADIKRLHGEGIGEMSQQGFGLTLVGTWQGS